MRRLLQNAVWIFLFISFVYFPVTRGYAETPRFTVIPELPQNQASEATYFDLLVNKETVQELIIADNYEEVAITEKLLLLSDILNMYEWESLFAKINQVITKKMFALTCKSSC